MKNDQKETKIEPKKAEMAFYTAFIIGMADSNTHKVINLHCTHKYLGVLDAPILGEVVKVIREYFKQPRKFPLAIFNGEADFDGKRVLLSHIKTECFFEDLREELSKFRADDHPHYRPHITVAEYPEVNGVFQAYAIMHKQNVLAYWENPEWQKVQKRLQKTSSQRLTDLARKTLPVFTKQSDRSGNGPTAGDLLKHVGLEKTVSPDARGQATKGQDESPKSQ